MKQKHTAIFKRLIENENGHKNIIHTFCLENAEKIPNIKKKLIKNTHTQLLVIKKTPKKKKLCPKLHIT